MKVDVHVQSTDKKGFYITKKHPTLAVNTDGQVYDLIQKVILEPRAGPHGYAVIAPLRRGILPIHQLVADTFLTKPDVTEKLVINHIDGNKANPKLENLEWVTFSGNLVHAYQTGLRNDNKRLEVMDLRSGEIKQFHSLQETARFFKRNGEVIFRYLKSQRTSPFMSYFNIRHVDEEWPALTAEHVGTHQNGQAREIIAVPEDTSKSSMIFSGLGAAAKIFECSAAAICKNIKQPVDKLFRGYKFYYLAGYDKDVSNFLDCRETIKEKPTPPTRKPCMVKVTNLRSGSIKVYDSLEEFCDKKGVSKHAAQRSVWRNNGRFSKYLIEYIR